ncbi:MAG: acyl-CoA dehydrogenase family protein [Ardenticatenaceae bacterium]|nr:acyl-CoA dehydrogenase family protein [Ardenticatenaceae bacterium]
MAKITHYNQTETLPADTVGRNRLQEWLDAQPQNYFSADTDLQRKLELYFGAEKYREIMPRLYQFGITAAVEIDPLARKTNLDRHLPVLEVRDAIGQDLNDVDYTADYHQIGRYIYGSEIMTLLGQPGNNRLALALFYLSAQNGEAGHNCPLACTAGVIKVLRETAPEILRERYLPPLLNPDYDQNYTGAQYFTEVQGGSDVGINAAQATPEDNNSDLWFLNGEKWFCSNVTADLALVTARANPQDGTRGLDLFLVPRVLDDGRPNGIHIKRLKDKMGTRSLATAEVQFENTQAYRVGTFKDGMAHVINTSRVFNAFGCAGHARRALTIAWTYAQNRIAFNQPIVRFPIVQAQLSAMRADAAAMLAGSMRIAKIIDDVETGKASDADQKFLRMAINLNKYRTAVLAHEVIMTAIELLGGNGTIESFSVLPRLLRDNVVFENWEGTHNVLMAQVQRDARKYAVHEPFLAHVRTLLEAISDPKMEEFKKEGLHQLERIVDEIKQVLEMDELTGAIYFRPLMDRLTDLFYAATMGLEATWERSKKEDKTKQRLAIYFMNHRVNRKQPGDIYHYDDQVARLSAEI